MEASFRRVTAKNDKILTLTRTGNFLSTCVNGLEFYATHMDEKMDFHTDLLWVNIFQECAN